MKYRGQCTYINLILTPDIKIFTIFFMLKQSRLEIPGMIYHIIDRGINKDLIYKDHPDKNNFLKRLEKSLKKIKLN